MPAQPHPQAMVFLHSYDSIEPNWHAVVFGSRTRPGRLRTALAVARELNAPVIADDGFDHPNQRLYRRVGIENIGKAKTTHDEVTNFLAQAPRAARKVFVTSPDHLPRVARDALAMQAENAVFTASATPYTRGGVTAVQVRETR